MTSKSPSPRAVGTLVYGPFAFDDVAFDGFKCAELPKCTHIHILQIYSTREPDEDRLVHKGEIVYGNHY